MEVVCSLYLNFAFLFYARRFFDENNDTNTSLIESHILVSSAFISTHETI